MEPYIGIGQGHPTTVFKAQGWRNGESTRLPPMWPGFKSLRRRHMWALSLLLVISLDPRGFFPGTLGFPAPSKFQFDQESGRRRTT